MLGDDASCISLHDRAREMATSSFCILHWRSHLVFLNTDLQENAQKIFIRLQSPACGWAAAILCSTCCAHDK